MPQEIEVWYLIPAIRKELAKEFVNVHKLNQKQAAFLLGITESAISQYVKGKRGNELHFSDKEFKNIKETANKMKNEKNEKNLMKLFFDLCVSLRSSKVVCEIHKSLDSKLSKKCDMCFTKD